MPTARERMLELTSLTPPDTAGAHFLSIEQVVIGGGETIIQAPCAYIFEFESLASSAGLSALEVIMKTASVQGSHELSALEIESALCNV